MRFVQVPAKTRHATLFYQNDDLGTPQEPLDESGVVEGAAADRACDHDTSIGPPSVRHSIDRSRMVRCGDAA